MSINNFSPPLISLDLHILQNFSNNEEKRYKNKVQI